MSGSVGFIMILFYNMYLIYLDVKPTFTKLYLKVRSSGRVVERRTVNRGDCGSIPPAAVSKHRQFRIPHICLSFGRETKSPVA